MEESATSWFASKILDALPLAMEVFDGVQTSKSQTKYSQENSLVRITHPTKYGVSNPQRCTILKATALVRDMPVICRGHEPQFSSRTSLCTNIRNTTISARFLA